MSAHTASARNFEAITHAIDFHNETCKLGGVAVALLMHPLEIERMGWEAGDDIHGCELREDPSQPGGTFFILCSKQEEHDHEEAEDATAGAPRVGEKVAA